MRYYPAMSGLCAHGEGLVLGGGPNLDGSERQPYFSGGMRPPPVAPMLLVAHRRPYRRIWRGACALMRTLRCIAAAREEPVVLLPRAGGVRLWEAHDGADRGLRRTPARSAEELEVEQGRGKRRRDNSLGDGPPVRAKRAVCLPEERPFDWGADSSDQMRARVSLARRCWRGITTLRIRHFALRALSVQVPHLEYLREYLSEVGGDLRRNVRVADRMQAIVDFLAEETRRRLRDEVQFSHRILLSLNAARMDLRTELGEYDDEIRLQRTFMLDATKDKNWLKRRIRGRRRTLRMGPGGALLTLGLWIGFVTAFDSLPGYLGERDPRPRATLLAAVLYPWQCGCCAGQPLNQRSRNSWYLATSELRAHGEGLVLGGGPNLYGSEGPPYFPGAIHPPPRAPMLVVPDRCSLGRIWQGAHALMRTLHCSAFVRRIRIYIEYLKGRFERLHIDLEHNADWAAKLRELRRRLYQALRDYPDAGVMVTQRLRGFVRSISRQREEYLMAELATRQAELHTAEMIARQERRERWWLRRCGVRAVFLAQVLVVFLVFTSGAASSGAAGIKDDRTVLLGSTRNGSVLRARAR